MRALLVSTYDLGRQSFGLASGAAALTANGVKVACLDLAKQKLDEALVAASDAIAFYLPMHTATRLALPVIERVRALNPAARLYAYGLYAPINAAGLRTRGVHHIIGGEFEDELVARVLAPDPPQGGPLDATGRPRGQEDIPRVRFHVPLRSTLPPLARYATLQVGGVRKTVGYTEASRGCKHRCRHCPIVPVYDGRFRIVPIPIVLADVRAQVAAGAGHITFGDPDFLNGVRHAHDLLRAFAAEFPHITYDATIKVEHLLRHTDLMPVLRDTGCLFVTSAVESIDDRVLATLEKGHTRADFERVVLLCRAAGVMLAPTFVAFTPWTTLAGYCDLLHAIDGLGLVEQVAPIQLAIRLLIPEGSRLLELEDVRRIAGPYSPDSLVYPWQHQDPRVDELQRHIEQVVGKNLGADRSSLFTRIWADAHRAAGIAAPPRRETGALPRAAIPYLNEPWYC
jgi:Radical SAM superfamily